MFVTTNMIKKHHEDLFANQHIIFINEDSNNVAFCGGEMSMLSVDLDKIKIYDVNFNVDDTENIIHV